VAKNSAHDAEPKNTRSAHLADVLITDNAALPHMKTKMLGNVSAEPLRCGDWHKDRTADQESPLALGRLPAPVHQQSGLRHGNGCILPWRLSSICHL
jgi:hypothetical protein